MSTYTEEISVAGGKLKSTLKNILREGNVRRIRGADDNEVGLRRNERVYVWQDLGVGILGARLGHTVGIASDD